MLNNKEKQPVKLGPELGRVNLSNMLRGIFTAGLDRALGHGRDPRCLRLYASEHILSGMSHSTVLPTASTARVALTQIRLGCESPATDALGSPSDKAQNERVVLRMLPGGGYELLAGYAAWRAARSAGDAEIDAWVYGVDDRAAALIALVEGVRRGELTPVDEARRIADLRAKHKVRQREIGSLLGRHQSSLSHRLRMLNRLVDSVQNLVARGQISLGHAKALMTVPQEEQQAWAEQAIAGRWSVKTLRQRLEKTRNEPDVDVSRLEQELTEKIGCTVKIEHRQDGCGSIRIDYFSLDEADGVFARLRTKPTPDDEAW